MPNIRKLGIWALVGAAGIVAAVACYREFALVRPMQRSVLLILKDPGSAQFKDLRYFGPWNIDGGVLCGEVNAKNELGGYTGYRRFQVFGHTPPVVSDSMNSGLDYGAGKFCDFSGVAPWWHLAW